MKKTKTKKSKKQIKLFTNIYNFIDKYLVLPISKLVFIIGNKITKSNGLEKILNKPNTLIYVSLALAILMFLLIDTKAINLTETNAEVIQNQDINITYNSSAYVIEGLPEDVDIVLTGRKSDLYLAKTLGNHQVSLDLSDYEDSEEPQKVKLTYNKPIDSLEFMLVPSEVTVTIKKKVSDIKDITHDLMNQDLLNEKLSVKSIELSKNEVVVKGSQQTIDEIASVKALVDLGDPRLTTKGTYDMEELKLIAYDESGKELPNVEIVSTSISAKIVLNSYSKEVPIKILTTGELQTGKAINTIKINDASSYTVTIYGDSEDIDSIESVPVTIDVTDKGNKDASYNVSINKPSKVRHISESKAKIDVTFGEAKQKTITGVEVGMQNAPSGLNVTAKSQEETKVDVQIVGVDSIIKNITKDDIKAYIDLTNYTVGEHKVEVFVSNGDSRVKYIVTKKVTVVITK